MPGLLVATPTGACSASTCPNPVPTRWPGAGNERSWTADVGAGIHTDFRAKWNELLRQIWLGVEYTAASSAANPTDPAYIRLLIESLRDMMANRRRGGLLAREEFASGTVVPAPAQPLRVPAPQKPAVASMGSTNGGRR